MSRILTRGPKSGTCNICGIHGVLTEDHTPPKGSIRLTQVEMRHIVELLAVEPPGYRGRISQNGVKYRTLCANCNNDVLGLHYDPEFTCFVNNVGSIVKSELTLPHVMHVKAKPQKVIRSLIGHLMAQRVDGFEKGPHTEDLRDWFLDESRPVPVYMKVYYWVYPYKAQILARDAVMRVTASPDTAYFWLMKFFPIAFLVVWDSPSGYDFSNLRSFDLFHNMQPDDEVEIPIDLVDLPHERWPEAPDDNRFCAFGSGAIGVTEKKPKKKRI